MMLDRGFKKIIPIILFLSLAITIGYNEYNLHLIREKNPKNELTAGPSTVENITVWDVDNEFYIGPAENFLAGKGLRRDPAIGNGSYFRRVPGYSMIYLFFRLFFDVRLALTFLKFFQVFLFALSIVCVNKIVGYLKFNSMLSAFISLLYGCTPFFSGFTYFTCTESVTPALCVFFFYFLIKGISTEDIKKKKLAYWFCGIFFGISILTRPNMALLGLAIPFCMFADYKNSRNSTYSLKTFAPLVAVPILLLSIWTVRNFIVTKEVVILEKASHPESLDREKPEYFGILRFVKCWGGPAIDNFNDYYIPFQSSVLIDGDSSNVFIEKILSAWPQMILNEFGRERLFTLLKKHRNALFKQKPYYDKQIVMPSSYFEEELEVEKDWDELVKEYKQKHFMAYWLKAPLLNLKAMTLHSNTSQLLMFQRELIGRRLFIYKSFLFLFNILLYLTVLINLFLIKDRLLKAIFVLTPLLSIFFFCFIFRGIEQRYMLPVLPVMVIGLAFPIHYLFNKRPFFGKR